MKKNPNILLLHKLNKRPLMQFELHGDTFSADYFSWELLIHTFINGYMVVAVRGNDAKIFITECKRNLLTAQEVVAHLTQFRQEHPFTISTYGHGRYQLLDPDGFDYCGEYVTLRDARRTSEGFYKMG